MELNCVRQKGVISVELENGSSIGIKKTENSCEYIMDKSIDAEGLARKVLKGRGEFSIYMKTCQEKQHYRNTAIYFLI